MRATMINGYKQLPYPSHVVDDRHSRLSPELFGGEKSLVSWSVVLLPRHPM